MLKGTELAAVVSEQSGRTAALIKAKSEYVAEGISSSVPIFIKQAKGAVIEDIDGNRYLDFYSGIGVTTAGHCPDSVVDAIRNQAEALLHSCFMVSMYEPYVKLAQKLAEITPGDMPKKAMFVNSGAEAVENAVKIARAYTGRQGIISFESGFHGRTLLTMSLTSKVKPYKHGFGPYAPEIYKVPFPNVYRGQLHVSEDEACRAYLDYFERFFVAEADPSHIAAIILEPVQGEGGFNIPPKGYWKGLREICDKHGILLIADEVQTGFCRTGKMFAVEHFDVVPDLMTLAKSIASGMPLSAVVGKKEIMDSAGAGRIGGTYGGNPLACEAALATIRFMEENDLASKALAIGEKIMARLKKLQAEFPQIGDTRGLGAMIGIELVKDPAAKEPDKASAAAVIAECVKQGLLIIGAGIYGNVIRFLPPLVLTDGQLKQAMDIFETSVRKVLKK
ncbi:4-aminobutyrate--2-oxoglutarate transaminase [Geovibrio thiophilus]|uniref:4-aminobutyrate--2-oxoglutarate transaminase n=1 Tax=Geovibrio thiophilus TaxID=139438 RepID=A0A3R5YYM9_9BACT|nr:4-aminobutyrate--2-oxoglutarate transaminase [Geovibrio thiophilus]QAR32655.1 4-aminobutyrate--2-oxoglutarate transaminase [Geovibrio thiophilus]